VAIFENSSARLTIRHDYFLVRIFIFIYASHGLSMYSDAALSGIARRNAERSSVPGV